MDDGGAGEMVLPPTARTPNGSTLTAIPSTVTAEPPSETILGPIEKADGFDVKD